MKKQLSFLLAIVFAFSMLSVSVGAAYEIYVEDPDGPYNEVNNSDVTIWAGGGKATLPNGAVVDGKTKQFNLFEEDEDGKYWNVTTAKTTLWALTTSSAKKVADSSYKLASDAATKDFAKISKGKITAGKKAGTVYAQAVAGVVKGTSSGVNAGVVEVNVKQAATAIQVKASNSAASDTIKMIAAPLGESITVNVFGMVKSGKDYIAAHEDNTFSVAVDAKSKGYFEINAGNGWDSSGASDIAVNSSGYFNFNVKGMKLKEGKIFKGKVIITNEQSGKKATLSVSVDNSVLSTTSPAALAFEVGSDAKENEKQTKEVAINTSVIEYTSAGSLFTTDAPKLIVVDGTISSSSSGNWIKNADLFAKGKVKINSKDLKTKEKVTAKYDKNKKLIAVTVDKSTIKATNVTVVAVFNANMGSSETPKGVLYIPVNISAKTVTSSGA
ncbi:MAG: hypothetical protein LBR74_09720 [Eubacterium sp.]|jgi:hypothetical protein|nr:hypothetical protein [Eubacterium sp.]